jgi:predicted nuclease of predicted toxin-antitoxin system
MRFLANENFPGAAVSVLKFAGHDVVWVRTTAPGTSDPEVLAWAARESRILLTFDKDFGELARASALPPSWAWYCSASRCRDRARSDRASLD